MHAGGHGALGVGAVHGGTEVHGGVGAEAGVHEGLEEHREAEGAGVDDAVLLKDGKEVGGARHGLVGLGHELLEGLLHGHGAVVGQLVGALREVGDDGEDGPLDGLADRLERDLAAVAPCGGEVGDRDGVSLGIDEALGHAAQDLAGDDAGVAAGAHERAVRDGLGDGLHGGVGRKGLDLLHHGLEREAHVGSGVAVGDGEDVELVDLVRPVGDRLGGDGEAVAYDVRNHSVVTPVCLSGAVPRACRLVPAVPSAPSCPQ